MSAHKSKSKISRVSNTLKYKRRLSRKRKTAKIFRMFFLSITGLVLFSVAFYLYTLTLVLKEPFVKASGSTDFNQKNYDSTSDFNVMFVRLKDIKDESSKIEEMYLYRLSPVDSYAVTIHIPTYAEISGFSKEPVPISELYFLGNVGDEKRGISNLKKFVIKNLALNIDAYVLYDGETINSLKEADINFNNNSYSESLHYRSFLKITKIFDILRANIKSDLTSVEVFKLITDTKNIKSDKFKTLEVVPDDLISTSNFDENWHSATNLDLNTNFRNSAIVLNSTSTKGLALWGARIVKNVGGSIVDVGNSDDLYNETTIYTNDYNLPLVDYLVKTLKIKKVKSTNDYLEDTFLASRADVLLILGKDTASLY